MLQHCVEDLHVVWIPGIGKLIEDHQLHHGAQVVSVSIQQLSGESIKCTIFGGEMYTIYIIEWII